MNNKKLGTSFEKEVCDKLQKLGFWVHFITPDNRGAQPFDIIAVRRNVAMAVECKTLSTSQRYFPISRLEDNQIFAFKKWADCGNSSPMIAIKYGDEIKFVSYSLLEKEGKVDMKDYERVI